MTSASDMKELNKIIIEPSRKHQHLDPATPNKSDMMRAKIRQILWTSNHNRPGISCNISFLASKLKAANVKDLLAVNKVIRKIKDNHHNIEYQPLGDKIKIALFKDAVFANHEDGGSQGGHLIFSVDENSKFNLISWQSKRI